jgi:hypothetical protein
MQYEHITKCIPCAKYKLNGELLGLKKKTDHGEVQFNQDRRCTHVMSIEIILLKFMHVKCMDLTSKVIGNQI